ncbi:hypothetical protein Sste5344_003450 [Sporothrix stenoceras]
MAELAKPISQVDEPGYIYMFWLTPESQQASPPADAARSLLLPPSRPAGGHRRRASDVVASFAAESTSVSNGPAADRRKARPVPRSAGSGERADADRAADRATKSKGTLLLKIGRANNVQRRLNEWKRQCGYNLSLIRFYPYLTTSGRSLDCEVCGREHREWFQVEATRKAIAEVDNIIRRWVDWDEDRL